MKLTLTLNGPETQLVLAAVTDSVKRHERTLERLRRNTRRSTAGRNAIARHEAALTDLLVVERRLSDAQDAQWSALAARLTTKEKDRP